MLTHKSERITELGQQMFSGICSQFVLHPIEQVDPFKIVDILENVGVTEQRLETELKTALQNLLTPEQNLALQQVVKIKRTILDTDLRTMAENAPEFFNTYFHERCLLRGNTSFKPDEKLTDNNKTIYKESHGFTIEIKEN